MEAQEKTVKKTIKGVVVSDKMEQSIVVSIAYRKTHPRFKKFLTRSKKIMAHDAQNTAKIGDVVSIVQTRPFSKRKKYELVEVLEKAEH